VVYSTIFQQNQVPIMALLLHLSLISSSGSTMATMTPRTDLITASRVDLALILLPAITWLEASYMLAVSGVPVEVAARVLVLPAARRTLREGSACRRPC
jgi:hypothetical protein